LSLNIGLANSDMYRTIFVQHTCGTPRPADWPKDSLGDITIEQAKALPNLLQINIEDIVKWDPTSALVVFKVTEPPIIVKAKELASQHRQAKTAC
jgi:hypothetical protein